MTADERHKVIFEVSIDGAEKWLAADEGAELKEHRIWDDFTARPAGSVSLAVLKASRRPRLVVWPPVE